MYHLLNLLFAQFGVHRQRKYLFLSQLALSEFAGLVAQRFVHVLEMQAQWIIDHSLDALGFQVLAQLVAVQARVLETDSVVVAGGLVALFKVRGLDTIYPVQQLGIECCLVATQLVPAVQVLQLYSQDSSLQGVETTVEAVHDVLVACLGAMNPENPHCLGDLGIISDHHATIAIRSQILGGKEAQTSNIAQRANFLSFLFSAQRLSTVLNYFQVMLSG